MSGWKIVYNDRQIEYVPGDDVLDALQEARRRNKRPLEQIRLVEWQRRVV